MADGIEDVVAAAEIVGDVRSAEPSSDSAAAVSAQGADEQRHDEVALPSIEQSRQPGQDNGERIWYLRHSHGWLSWAQVVW